MIAKRIWGLCGVPRVLAIPLGARDVPLLREAWLTGKGTTWAACPSKPCAKPTLWRSRSACKCVLLLPFKNSSWKRLYRLCVPPVWAQQCTRPSLTWCAQLPLDSLMTDYLIGAAMRLSVCHCVEPLMPTWVPSSMFRIGRRTAAGSSSMQKNEKFPNT